MQTLPLRAVLAASIVAILGSLWYYAFTVTWWALAAIVALAVGIAWGMPLEKKEESEKSKVATGLHVGLALVAIVALAAWWNSILAVDITEAMRSPWLVVPPFSIVALGIAMTATLFLFTLHARRTATTLLAATLFSAFAMAAVVYPLGFGFDPFLHRATIGHIAEFGSITPKPLYYIGEYALELTLVVVGRLPLVAVDRFLLPVFATVALVGSAAYGLAPLLRKNAVALTGLLLLPFGAFISTTPQGIAYAFALSAIFLTFHPLSIIHYPRIAPWLLAIAALLTHPFAGIPVVLYVAAWHSFSVISVRRQRTAVLVGSGIAAVAAIPALFAAQAARADLALEFHPGNLFQAQRWSSLALDGFFRNQFSSWYDGIYLIIDNLFLLTVVIGLLGAVAMRRTQNERSDSLRPFDSARLLLIFAAGMFANFLLLSIAFDFDFLIAYERSDYAVRALTLTRLFLMPCVIAAVAIVDEQLAEKPRALRITMLVLLAAAGMANVYGAYPRHDNYARSAGFNVSTADFNAVTAIAQQADDEQNYIVLANQATSAAAVERDGFARYYHGDIFYYPIPTGGPLYEKYLSMVNDAPTRETMIAAMDIASDPDAGRPVDLAYFAVSDYWWKSEIIIENAKREADDWFAVDGGAVTVFVFRRGE